MLTDFLLTGGFWVCEILDGAYVNDCCWYRVCKFVYMFTPGQVPINLHMRFVIAHTNTQRNNDRA